MIHKYKYEITIEIDEEQVVKKYPNYSINYDHPDELANVIGMSSQYEADTDMSIDGMEDWGYSIKAKKIE